MKYLFLECLFSNILKRLPTAQVYYKITRNIVPQNEADLEEMFLPYKIHSQIHCYAHKYFNMFGGMDFINKITTRLCNESIVEIASLYKQYKDLIRTERISTTSYEYSTSYSSLLSALCIQLKIEDFDNFDFSILDGMHSQFILEIIKNSKKEINAKDLTNITKNITSISEKDLFYAVLEPKKADTDVFKEVLLLAKKKSIEHKSSKGWYSPYDRSKLFYFAVCRYLLTGDEETLDLICEKETSPNFLAFYRRDYDELFNFMQKNGILRVKEGNQTRWNRHIEILEAYKGRLEKLTTKIVRHCAKSPSDSWRTQNIVNNICFWMSNQATYVSNF